MSKYHHVLLLVQKYRILTIPGVYTGLGLKSISLIHKPETQLNVKIRKEMVFQSQKKN